jgi:hypothetical protein
MGAGCSLPEGRVQNAGYLHGRRVQGAGYLSEDAKMQNDGYLVEGYGVLAT